MNINEQFVLIKMVSDYFIDDLGDIKHKNTIKEISYFEDIVEVVFTDNQTLAFSVKKFNK